jgi:hypothetical protein
MVTTSKSKIESGVFVSASAAGENEEAQYMAPEPATQASKGEMEPLREKL